MVAPAVVVYVEGGGRKDLDSRARKAFARLFTRLGLAGRLPRVHPCGSRAQAYRDFCTAIGQRDTSRCYLLVDSEDPVRSGDTSWDHLRNRTADRWPRPQGAGDSSAHLMVQCMEAWLLADRQAVRDYYGEGFEERALPRNPNVEEVDKRMLLDALAAASKGTTKGRYGKGKHSFDLLERVDPEKLRRASSFAASFFDEVSRS